MLDIKFIRENREEVEKSTNARGYKVDFDKLLKLDEERRNFTVKLDDLRAKRNEVAGQMKGGKPSNDLIAEGKKIKEELAQSEPKLDEINSEYLALLNSVPNTLSPDTPIGDETVSTVVREWGDKKSGAMDHYDFALNRDWVDFDRGTKVAGNKFYFIKGDLVLLEMALVQYAMKKIVSAGFKPMTVPHMVTGRVMAGAGFTPRTSDQSDQYAIEGEDLELIATSEIALTGYHADEIIDEKDLPLLYAGYSPCYRKEAGAAGKFNRGLFRVHQFNKLEMYAFCTPEQSADIHAKILATEEEICQGLGIPYRVINIASGDLGAPAWKKYDLEWFSPVDETYREITSCSNCTDYQARNLNIRVRRESGDIETLHTLNGTAVALSRLLMVILECFQNGDKLIVPEVLRPYMDNRTEL